MDFYNEIKDKSEEEVKEITRKKIQELEEKSNQENSEEKYIGYNLDYNPKDKKIILDGEDDTCNYGFLSRCFYYGYLSKNTKVTYGLLINNRTGEMCNRGCYYYLNDDSYIYEFCEFIKDKDVEDEYDILHYILEFMLAYFRRIELLDREVMHKLIRKDDRTYFPPIKEHSLTDFKEKGNALCSEYAVMAQNLMSVFGISSSIVIGAEKVNGTGIEQHAYNIIELPVTDTEEDEEEREQNTEEKKEKKKEKKKAYIADFQNYIATYDIDYEILDIMPFLGEIDDYSDEFLKEFIHDKKELTYEDYGYMVIGNHAFKMGYEKTRTYFIDNIVYGEKTLAKRNR